MNSLYWRIFVAFWIALALILVGTVTVAVNGELNHRFSQPWVQRAVLYTQATRAFESGGAGALREWLRTLRPPELLAHTFVVGSDGRELLGRVVPEFLQAPPDRFVIANRTTLLPPSVRLASGPLVLVGPDGKTFRVIVGPFRAGPHLFGELEIPSVSMATLLIALVVSGGVCLVLARYLVAPVDQLREATRQIAAGDLHVRVSPRLRGRQDDLGLLAADLDTMAERVRSLLESKQQLLRDVSHELRSPLTRLQLALSLARREGDGAAERHLVRIACEADRLEQLIARTLKLASLEGPLRGLERTSVDLSVLLTHIVADVGIEADAHQCVIRLEAVGDLVVRGDLELLRSSVENVVRNALRYSPPDSRVDVSAGREGEEIRVCVTDSGPGVPEKDLDLIFEPFYRVDAARNRAVGGDGLGLAIAARAVGVHGGRIRARNRPEGGLMVQIDLPAIRAEERRPALPASGEAAGSRASMLTGLHELEPGGRPS